MAVIKISSSYGVFEVHPCTLVECEKTDSSNMEELPPFDISTEEEQE